MRGLNHRPRAGGRLLHMIRMRRREYEFLDPFDYFPDSIDVVVEASLNLVAFGDDCLELCFDVFAGNAVSGAHFGVEVDLVNHGVELFVHALIVDSFLQVSECQGVWMRSKEWAA